MIEGVSYFPSFVESPEDLFNYLKDHVEWDERMYARRTASYGVAYNYSQMHYPYQEMLPGLRELVDAIPATIGFSPNNCLINYYLDGKSTMGFHSDQTDILNDGTGVCIISVGDARTLRFRNIENKEQKVDYLLEPGSMVYMTQEVQGKWQHAIPKADSDKGRMSLTFRSIKE